MSKFLVSALALVGLLVACSREEHLMVLAKERIASQLKDPDSAKFRDTFIVEQAEEANGMQKIAVCGIVDGKNSFGAFTGGTRFVVAFFQVKKFKTLDVASVNLESSDNSGVPVSRGSKLLWTPFEAVYWDTYCVDHQHPPTYSGK